MTVPDTTVVPPTMILPANDREAAAEFSAVILKYSVGEVASAAKRTKDAAKKWKAGNAMPCGLALMQMAQTLPAVRNWMLSKLGPSFQQNSPQNLSMAVVGIQTLAAKPGPEGDAVREALRLMMGAGE
jgi:hypothetical protein